MNRIIQFDPSKFMTWAPTLNRRQPLATTQKAERLLLGPRQNFHRLHYPAPADAGGAIPIAGAALTLQWRNQKAI
jgi:hypothetical protein